MLRGKNCMKGQATYPACQALSCCITVAAAEEIKQLPCTTWEQTVVVGHDNYFFQLLQYAWFTGCTVLPRYITFQHIFAN